MLQAPALAAAIIYPTPFGGDRDGFLQVYTWAWSATPFSFTLTSV